MDYRHVNDNSLMKNIASGDRRAFKNLYERYCPLMLAIAVRIVKRREVAEDIMQDVFVQVWLTANAFDNNLSSPKTWLSHLTRNKAIDWLRARDNQWQSEEEITAQQSELTGATDSAIQDDESRRLLHCMKHLPNNQQQSIALAWYQGLSHTDIAQYLNQPTGTIKSWIRRGLEHLKECIGI